MGSLTPKNYKLALAWYRQAVRNGYIVAYEDSARVLDKGGPQLESNKLMALGYYLSSYEFGNVNLKETILRVIEECKKLGHRVPEIKFK